MEKREARGESVEAYCGSVRTRAGNPETRGIWFLDGVRFGHAQGRRKERALPGGPDPSASGRGEEGSAG